MSIQGIFKPKANGNGFDITPAGVLLVVAECAYSAPGKTAPKDMRDARTLVDGVLAAASAGGFAEHDILATLLSRNERSARVAEMAVAACNAAGESALLEIFAADGMA